MPILNYQPVGFNSLIHSISVPTASVSRAGAREVRMSWNEWEKRHWFLTGMTFYLAVGAAFMLVCAAFGMGR